MAILKNGKVILELDEAFKLYTLIERLVSYREAAKVLLNTKVSAEHKDLESFKEAVLQGKINEAYNTPSDSEPQQSKA